MRRKLRGRTRKILYGGKRRFLANKNKEGEKKGVVGGSKRALRRTRFWPSSLPLSQGESGGGAHKKSVWLGLGQKKLARDRPQKRGGVLEGPFLLQRLRRTTGRDKKGAKVSLPPDPILFRSNVTHLKNRVRRTEERGATAQNAIVPFFFIHAEGRRKWRIMSKEGGRRRKEAVQTLGLLRRGGGRGAGAEARRKERKKKGVVVLFFLIPCGREGKDRGENEGLFYLSLFLPYYLGK